MLHVQIQVLEATLGMSMNDLQFNRVEGNPFWMLDGRLRYTVMISSSLLFLCPRPCDVQGLEIHIRAATQPVCDGLHAEHCIYSALSFRDVYQEMLARLHQVELLAMNVLQVRIANGMDPSKSRCRRRSLRPRVDLDVVNRHATDGVIFAFAHHELGAGRVR